VALAIAFLARIPYSSILMGPGGDIPGMAMAGMRLYDTRPWAYPNILDNTFYQLIAYTRGYSRALIPFLTYYVEFGLLRIPITERALICVHALWGVASLYGIYLFYRQVMDRRASLLGLLLLAFVPGVIGMNRAFIDPNSIEFLCFYGSLAAMAKHLADGRGAYRWAFAVLTFFYIGAGNTVLVGLCMQAWFFLLMAPDPSLKDRALRGLRLASSGPVLALAVAPLLGMIALALVFRAHPTWGTGSIMHVFRDRNDLRTAMTGRFKPLDVIRVMPIKLGPVVTLLAPLALALTAWRGLRWKARPAALFLASYGLAFFVLIAIGDRPWTSNQIMLAPPIVGLACLAAEKSRHRWALAALVAISAATSMWMLYGPGREPRPKESYGYRIDHDPGMKTLAFLARSGELPVTRSTRGWGNSIHKIARYDIYLDYEGAWFYLSALGRDLTDRELSEWARDPRRPCVFVYRPGVATAFNARALAWIKDHRLFLIGVIRDGRLPVMEIYSNASRPLKNYDVADYNARFDRRYANLPEMARAWLGPG
jgi:hypothetical protein